MGIASSESVQRIQKLLETIEEKQLALITVTSNYNRLKIQIESSLKQNEKDLESAKESLNQAIKQLEVELVKFNPTLFSDRRGESCLKKS